MSASAQAPTPEPSTLTMIGAPADDMCGVDGCALPQYQPAESNPTTNQE
ncbi:hypothetical protein [Leucobacter komagatae]|nr:hypothetical protein [Leucobacter komagatae]